MYQVQITGDDVFTEYRSQVATLTHELVLERTKVRKLSELIDQYQKAVEERTREAARRRPVPVTTPQEELPEPPSLPGVPQGRAETRGD